MIHIDQIGSSRTGGEVVERSKVHRSEVRILLLTRILSSISFSEQNCTGKLVEIYNICLKEEEKRRDLVVRKYIFCSCNNGVR